MIFDIYLTNACFCSNHFSIRRRRYSYVENEAAIVYLPRSGVTF
jgi:hypothetical protein